MVNAAQHITKLFAVVDDATNGRAPKPDTVITPFAPNEPRSAPFPAGPVVG